MLNFLKKLFGIKDCCCTETGCGTQNPAVPRKAAAKFLGEAEKNLGVKILEFSKVLEKSVLNSNPTYLVTFLMELAQDWSSFYANNSVLNADNEDLKNSRILLAQKVLQVLEKGTSILGFGIPEVM
jgi:arginyl-tRNA synthetase